MKKKKVAKVIISLIMAASLLNGCDLVPMPEAASETDTEETITTLGLEPDLSYDRPVVEAHIEIDQLGYEPGQKKTAIFRGENLGSEFRVVSADSGETVYTGEIKTKAVAGTDSSYCYGDFTDVTEEGTYCIQTDVIGYSYPFEISDDLYNGLKEDALKQFYYNRCGYSLTSTYAGEYARNACHTGECALRQDGSVQLDVTGGWHVDNTGDRNVGLGCDALEAMLLAYEYNADSFGDDVGIPESGNGIPDILDEIHTETDWLLKMQDQSSGAVYESVSVIDSGDSKGNTCIIEDIDMSATLSFASALGYFSYIYQTYDSEYATTCLQAADRAMKYAAKFSDTADPDEYFRAAAMLYRATGYANYRNIINNYMATAEDIDMSDNVVFTGCVTYLATKQKTVNEYCDLMTAALKSYAVELSSSRGDYLYLMGEETKETDNISLLAEIARLTVVNYMISSNEYEVLMEKYLHYFCGCNPQNTCYVGQYGYSNITETQTASDILKQPVSDAYFILLMSGIQNE